mmetsp:Transcript_24459/g.63141  ORF Transcript_24459/g.63141 Transcript_24459/m.63141 type:complete len:200 (-) Transcript_24459:1047-1646(-)
MPEVDVGRIARERIVHVRAGELAQLQGVRVECHGAQHAQRCLLTPLWRWGECVRRGRRVQRALHGPLDDHHIQLGHTRRQADALLPRANVQERDEQAQEHRRAAQLAKNLQVPVELPVQILQVGRTASKQRAEFRVRSVAVCALVHTQERLVRDLDLRDQGTAAFPHHDVEHETPEVRRLQLGEEVLEAHNLTPLMQLA